MFDCQEGTPIINKIKQSDGETEETVLNFGFIIFKITAVYFNCTSLGVHFAFVLVFFFFLQLATMIVRKVGL